MTARRGRTVAAGTAAYETLLERQRADFHDALLLGVRRLRWDADRLAAERQRRLRELLTWASQRAPFWRDRLAGFDLSSFTEADLARLPALGKTEMMAEFDRLVTDPDLTLEAVEDHVGDLDEDAYLDERYRVIATSGTTGARAFFVYGWDDWVTFTVLSTRWAGRAGDDPSLPAASFFAASTRHISGALRAFVGFPFEGSGSVHLSATRPIHEVIAGCQAAQPATLHGYPSMIGLLAAEVAAGRLSIKPRWINTCGEQCTEEVRAAAREVWGVEIADYYGCSEGVYALPCAELQGMHLPDDLVILEPVDAEGNVVPFGQPAERLLLTNLYNRTQPLIRYELTDAMTLLDEPCPCGCAHRRIGEIRGRTNTYFDYGEGAVVHWLAMEGVLVGIPGTSDFQVRQTVDGLEVSIVVHDPSGLDRLHRELVELLQRNGVPSPVVNIQEVDSLERLWTGKVQQFQRLSAGA